MAEEHAKVLETARTKVTFGYVFLLWWWFCLFVCLFVSSKVAMV